MKTLSGVLIFAGIIAASGADPENTNGMIQAAVSLLLIIIGAVTAKLSGCGETYTEKGGD